MNIYFVCTGNTCRSPMAEGILRAREIPEMEVRSAGIQAVQGMPISDHAKELLENAKAPYTATSNEVSVEDVNWADHILTMTAAHKQMMDRMFPHAASKIHTLKVFVAYKNGEDVQDPYGGNLAIYRETFQELSTLMERLEGKL